MKYTIPQDASLLEALASLFPQSSKTTLRSWIKEGRVQVGGTILKNAQLGVLEGQELLIGNRKKFIGNQIPIIYEDADLIVIDKPSGLLSVATAFEKGDTAHGLLKAYYRSRRVYIVHRLDQDTSGVMLFAFNEEACQRLKKIFEAHDIERSYTAIVDGQMEVPSGKWESFLFEDDQYVVHTTHDAKKGEKAITHFETVSSNKRYSWLNLTLETGKKNQIRVHCQEAGHSVVGDKKYGSHANPIRRLCLHAHLLAFNHPISHKAMRFESPVPEDFYKVMRP